LLHRSAWIAWHRRWLCSVSTAAQSALAASLAEPSALWTAGPVLAMPEDFDVVLDHNQPPAGSRLPLR